VGPRDHVSVVLIAPSEGAIFRGKYMLENA